MPRSLLSVLLVTCSLSAHAGWDSALQEIRDEAKVQDVTRKGSILYVGVYDNGQRRDGYAQYLCESLRYHKVPGSSVDVYVMDIVKIARDNDWVKLGSYHCPL